MNESARLENSLRIIGLSYHTAPVALRERLAFRSEDLPRALSGLIAHGCREAAILSTCNRVEIIALAKDAATNTSAQVHKFLAEYHRLPEQEFVPSLYELKGCDAARHLFEVVASLDSQILGETEILAQSKEAYRVAAEQGTCGVVLHGIFERSFFLSKQLRTEGGISRSQASVSSAAVALAKKVFEIKGRKILVVGTGEMATGIVRALRIGGVSEILVASRTAARAEKFALREGGKPCLMQHLEEHLARVDIVLVSTTAPHYIIGPAQLEAAISHRRGHLLCVIDISVPRAVDPAIHKLENIFLYDIDDLEEIARDGRREREAVAERWRPRLAEEARLIFRQLQDSEPRDVARKLIKHIEVIRQDILKQVCTSGTDPKAAAELDRALELLQGRFLHGPLEMLKQGMREGDGDDAAAWISKMFRLEAVSGTTTIEPIRAKGMGEGETPRCKGVLPTSISNNGLYNLVKDPPTDPSG